MYSISFRVPGASSTAFSEYYAGYVLYGMSEKELRGQGISGGPVDRVYTISVLFILHILYVPYHILYYILHHILYILYTEKLIKNVELACKLC